MKRKIAAAVSLLLVSVGLAAGAAPAPAVAGAAPIVKPAPGAPTDAVLSGRTSPKAGASAGVKGNPVKERAARKRAKLSATCQWHGGSACYDYADGYQTFASGAEPTMAHAQFRIDNPWLNRTVNGSGAYDSHSLAELFVGHSSTTSGEMNIVEIGVTKDVGVCSTANDLCLFVFSWTDGVGKLYNGSNPNWVPATCSNTAPYTTNPPCVGSGDISSLIGTTKNMRWEYFQNGVNCTCTSGWWAKFDNKWLGVMQATQWTGASPAETFVNADDVEIYGEIAGNYNAVSGAQDFPSCSDMGSGVHAGTSGDGNINTLTYGGTSTATSLTSFTTTPTMWDVVSYGGASPMTGIRYGGEGYDSKAEGLGGKGGCSKSQTAGGCPTTLCLNYEVCPDNSSTGTCNPYLQTAASMPVGGCTNVNGGSGAPMGLEGWENTSGTGKAWVGLHTLNCGAGSSVSLGAGTSGQFNSSWDGSQIHSIKRTA